MPKQQEDAMQLPALSPRRLAGVAALVCAAALTPACAAAVTGSPAEPAASTAAAASTPECATSGLVVWMDTVRSVPTRAAFITRSNSPTCPATLQLARLPGGLRSHPQRPSNRQPRDRGHHQADHGHPRRRRHRDGDTADHRPGQLRYHLLPARTDSGARQAGQSPPWWPGCGSSRRTPACSPPR